MVVRLLFSLQQVKYHLICIKIFNFTEDFLRRVCASVNIETFNLWYPGYLFIYFIITIHGINSTTLLLTLAALKRRVMHAPFAGSRGIFQSGCDSFLNTMGCLVDSHSGRRSTSFRDNTRFRDDWGPRWCVSFPSSCFMCQASSLASVCLAATC